MTWYQKTFKKYKGEIISGALFTTVCTLVSLVWFFMIGKSFVWTTVNPIEKPSFFARLFYSALTFVTLGALLYASGFYLALYRVIGNWKVYKEIKKIIWASLMGLMFFVIVPKVVDILNIVISFFYNIFAFVLYLFPSIGISIVVTVVYLYLKNETLKQK